MSFDRGGRPNIFILKLKALTWFLQLDTHDTSFAVLLFLSVFSCPSLSKLQTERIYICIFVYELLNYSKSKSVLIWRTCPVWPTALRIRAATGLATGTEAFTQRFTAKLVFRRVDQDVKETLFAPSYPLNVLLVVEDVCIHNLIVDLHRFGFVSHGVALVKFTASWCIF